MVDGIDAMADERRLLEALRLEWRLAWWMLCPALRESLRLPGFEIRDLEGRWGMWLGDRRQIVLSRRLIATHSWPCIREVLRHEMAHQVADQVFHEPRPAHGDRFKEACLLLNADPQASGTVPSIYQWIQQQDEPADPRVEKVRKLLALAASPHPHEAEVAMLKAHEWMARYNIDPARPAGREYVTLCVGSPALRHSAADDELAAVLRDFYFVETVYVSMAMPALLKPGHILEISGTRENVRMASYVFDFLRRSIADQLAARAIRPKRSQNDYATGFLKGVAEKLAVQRQTLFETAPRSRALITTADVDLRAYLRQRYPRMRARYRGGRNLDQHAYDAGKRDGRRVIIHKPVEPGAAARGRLLTAGAADLPPETFSWTYYTPG